MSSSEIVSGGTTCSRLKWVNGHRPRCLHAAASSIIGAVVGAGGVVRHQRLAGLAVA